VAVAEVKGAKEATLCRCSCCPHGKQGETSIANTECQTEIQNTVPFRQPPTTVFFALFPQYSHETLGNWMSA